MDPGSIFAIEYGPRHRLPGPWTLKDDTERLMGLPLSFLSFLKFTTQACESYQLDGKHPCYNFNYELIPTLESAVLRMFVFFSYSVVNLLWYRKEFKVIVLYLNCRAQWLRGRASNSRLREPGFETYAAVLKSWASFFTLHCSSSLSCINE